MKKKDEPQQVIRRMKSANGLVKNMLRDLQRTDDLRKVDSITRNLQTLLLTMASDVGKLRVGMEIDNETN